jgi:hypothetical protein
MTQETSTLQDFPLPASIQAVKAGVDFESYDDFYRYLLDNLPQNSPQTRKRYSSLVEPAVFKRAKRIAKVSRSKAAG